MIASETFGADAVFRPGRSMRAISLAIGILCFATRSALIAAPAVQVTERGEGASRELVVRTVDILEATVLIQINGKNVRTSVPSPIILNTDGRKEFVAVTVSPQDAQKAWSYNFKYGWKTGGQAAVPDAYQYSPPFKAGAEYKVSQGYLGAFSHKECTEDQYAIDWTMPEGTPICAARPGTVVAVRDDSNVSGTNPAFKNKANYITVKHPDGTYGDYVHLKMKGALVKLGDKVAAGRQIGLSGNTGFSSEPHIHFCVFRNQRKGMTLHKETLPVLFQNVDSRFTSPRGKCAPSNVSSPIPVPTAKLILNGIWKNGSGYNAIINGEIFKEGDKGKIKLPDRTVEILCRTISETSATVLMDGKETLELKLKP